MNSLDKMEDYDRLAEENKSLRGEVALANDLEVAANTVIYCYDKRPENFAQALASLKEAADSFRAANKGKEEL